MPDADSMTDEQLLDVLRLVLVPGVGPRIRASLLERFGTPEAVLAAPMSQLREVQGVGPKIAERVAAARDQGFAEEQIALCAAEGLTILTEGHSGYPRPLREIHDPPGALFMRGRLEPQDALAVAIVGTRHASHYGLQQAERLAGSLARAGFTITSGLARGIDAAAHRGALEAGGRTVAVLGSGVLSIYPPEHAQLAVAVSAAGAVLSESAPRAEPLPGNFPQRNRIISGMSLGVIVVEAGLQSGALITARLAMEQGREVFAVPGRVDSRTSRGCHQLLRDGAKLVETADDVLEELGPLVEPIAREEGPSVHHPAELLLNEVEQTLLAAFHDEPASIDQLVAESGLTIPQVLASLSVLEMRHLVRRLSGTTAVRI